MTESGFDKVVREDWVVVQPLTEERKTAGGIVMVSEGAAAMERRGLVLGAGPGTYTKDGVFVPNDIEAGDTITYTAIELEPLVRFASGEYRKVGVLRAQRVIFREPRQ